jgi:SAM-dependent methyltransferase
MDINRLKWDESVPLHVASPLYDVPAFRVGGETLESLELEELGHVRGLSLLHVQCHFGLDTLSWARHGARVTGVDYAPAAVATARELARETGTPARFVESNVYDLPKRLRGHFDIVYTAKGALCWLPDLERWARILGGFLRPGGRLYVLDDHPLSDLYGEDRSKGLRLEASYFRGRARREYYDGTYATSVRMRHRTSYSWIHPLGELVSAITGARLRVDYMHEFPYTYWKKFPSMVKRPGGGWQLPKKDVQLPLMFSLQATKPADRSRG